MRKTLVVCSFCGKRVTRKNSWVRENVKLKQKNYCSLKCLGQSQRKRKILRCENPGCDKGFERLIGSISLHNYCSSRCAAIVNNYKRGRTNKRCANPNCTKVIIGDRKYCSAGCIPKTASKYSEDSVLKEIELFVVKNKRIPLKQELMRLNSPARKFFGTWNKAIVAAGFKPNPVMFARKHVAKDGHKCDSLSEKILDDWFYRKKIYHERNVCYPGNYGLKTDFKVGDYWVEFFGLNGQHKKYDRLKRLKIRLAKKYRIKLMSIYPEDLFPVFKPEKALGQVIKG